jgi:hypothetical protein
VIRVDAVVHRRIGVDDGECGKLPVVVGDSEVPLAGMSKPAAI